MSTEIIDFKTLPSQRYSSLKFEVLWSSPEQDNLN